jgi:hypothetical protein
LIEGICLVELDAVNEERWTPISSAPPGRIRKKTDVPRVPLRFTRGYERRPLRGRNVAAWPQPDLFAVYPEPALTAGTSAGSEASAPLTRYYRPQALYQQA